MIKCLKLNGKQFSWILEEYDRTWGVQDVEMRTNSDGWGIYRWVSGEGVWRQVAGDCDFILDGLSLSGARKKLNRYFSFENEHLAFMQSDDQASDEDEED